MRSACDGTRAAGAMIAYARICRTRCVVVVVLIVLVFSPDSDARAIKIGKKLHKNELISFNE